MKIQKILCAVALLGLAMCGSVSASITQHTLQQISYGDSFDINTYGQLDWAIVGVNEKAGGSMISTTGSGNTTTLNSASPGGTLLDFSSSTYPYFTYNDGASPTSSAASPGDQAGYQYDEPAVDIFVPAGLTRLTMWLAAGIVGDASYQATLADGTTTGVVSYWAGDATYYLLQLDTQSDVAQTLRFSIQHPAIGNPSTNNAGLFAIAATETSSIPEPASILLLVSGLGGLFAVGKKRQTKLA